MGKEKPGGSTVAPFWRSKNSLALLSFPGLCPGVGSIVHRLCNWLRTFGSSWKNYDSVIWPAQWNASGFLRVKTPQKPPGSDHLFEVFMLFSEKYVLTDIYCKWEPQDCVLSIFLWVLHTPFLSTDRFVRISKTSNTTTVWFGISYGVDATSLSCFCFWTTWLCQVFPGSVWRGGTQQMGDHPKGEARQGW